LRKRAPPRGSRRATDIGIAILLVAAIFAVYWQTLHFGFVNYDDPITSRRTSMCAPGSRRKAWLGRSGISFAGNWFPLTWLSHMLDVELFGLDSGLHHLTASRSTRVDAAAFAFLRAPQNRAAQRHGGGTVRAAPLARGERGVDRERKTC